jgi:hypothetical protein
MSTVDTARPRGFHSLTCTLHQVSFENTVAIPVVRCLLYPLPHFDCDGGKTGAAVLFENISRA